MIFEIYFPDKIKCPPEIVDALKLFLQRISNRAAAGHVRYGYPKVSRKYMSRLIAEMKEYKKTGNSEQLYNAAVYAFLETFAPENKKFHFDPKADSVTRYKYGA